MPRILYKVYKSILSEQASCAMIGDRIYVEGEQQYDPRRGIAIC